MRERLIQLKQEASGAAPKIAVPKAAGASPLSERKTSENKILNAPRVASGHVASSVAQTAKPKAPAKKKKSVSAVVESAPRHIFSNLKSVDGSDIKTIAEQCGMNFTATKRAAKFDLDYGGQAIIPDKMAVVREDDQRYLGTVGTGRPIVQYVDNLQFTEILAEEGKAEYQFGGIIGDGRQAFLVMKAADCFEIYPGDKIECYFYIQSSHDSSQALTIVPTPLRPRNNTIFMHPDMHALKIRHTKKVEERRRHAYRGIAKVKAFFQEFEDSFMTMGTLKLEPGQLDTYLRSIFPDGKDESEIPQNRRDKVRDIMTLEPSLQLPPTKNTLLGAYFAVIYFCDHYLTVNKSQTKDALTSRIESKLTTDGASVKRKAEAFGKALKLKEKME
jgi:phage/plasmid-like protein (TIGR03299 family)